MTIEEYFGDWAKVIDKKELSRIMKWIPTLDDSSICPSKKNIFRAFKVCPFKDCKTIFIGMDPYPQRGVATGILFGNSADTPEENLSPSLKVIKDAMIDYTIPHGPIEFDNTLESLAKQGVLMINSALTCNINSVGSHVEIWRPFMEKLVEKISLRDNGLIFVLFGNQAKSLQPFIKGSQHVLIVPHPAYYARRNESMPCEVFKEVNKLLKEQYNEHLIYYRE